MAEKIVIDADEVMRVFLFLEGMNSFFHQEDHYQNIGQVQEFAHAQYPEIRALYYRVVWEWLTPDMQAKILER